MCCTGNLLEYLLRLGRPFTEAEARTVLLQVLQALAYLHDECHVMHRDIKVASVAFELHADEAVPHKPVSWCCGCYHSPPHSLRMYC